jgi:hypothetical protein
MDITSLNSKKENKFKSIFVYLLALVALGFIVYFGGTVLGNLENFGGRSALTAENLYTEAEVFLNDTALGTTPYEGEIKAGENKVALRSDGRQFETTLNFLPNSHVVIRRDLGISENFSSGQVFWIEKNNAQTVLSVTSEPSNASVFVDQVEVGKTPFSTGDIGPGDYDFRIELPGYEGQSARIMIQRGYNLNISIKLFPIPVPAKVDVFEGSEDLYDLSSANPVVATDTNNWAKAVMYWNTTRGVNLAGLGVNKEPVFDYFIDYKGDLYTKNGELISSPEDYEKLESIYRGGYLGRSPEGPGLTTQARETYQTLKSGAFLPSGTNARIKETGTGWLRVRGAAGLTGVEVARVDVGGLYQVLEQVTDWVKIKVSDGVEGWVSKTYVDIL